MKGLQAWEVCKPLKITFKRTCIDLKAGECAALAGVCQSVSQTCSEVAAAFLEGSTGQRSNKVVKATNDLAAVSSTRDPSRDLGT